MYQLVLSNPVVNSSSWGSFSNILSPTNTGIVSLTSGGSASFGAWSDVTDLTTLYNPNLQIDHIQISLTSSGSGSLDCQLYLSGSRYSNTKTIHTFTSVNTYTTYLVNKLSGARINRDDFHRVGIIPSTLSLVIYNSGGTTLSATNLKITVYYTLDNSLIGTLSTYNPGITGTGTISYVPSGVIGSTFNPSYAIISDQLNLLADETIATEQYLLTGSNIQTYLPLYSEVPQGVMIIGRAQGHGLDTFINQYALKNSSTVTPLKFYSHVYQKVTGSVLYNSDNSTGFTKSVICSPNLSQTLNFFAGWGFCTFVTGTSTYLSGANFAPALISPTSSLFSNLNSNNKVEYQSYTVIPGLFPDNVYIPGTQANQAITATTILNFSVYGSFPSSVTNQDVRSLMMGAQL